MIFHSSLLFILLLFLGGATVNAEDNSKLQVTSCSAEINSPTLQRLFDAVLNKSIANCESIEKAASSCDKPHTNSSILITIGCSCPQPCGMIKISLCLWTCSQHTRSNSTSKEASVCMSPTNETVSQAAIAVLRFFGWKRVYALFDSTTLSNVIQNILTEANITVSENIGVSVEQAAMYRIFLLVQVNTTQAWRALCDAYGQELFYSSGYAWVIVGVDMDELLNTTSTDMLLSMNCTLDMIKTVLNYTLVVEPAVTMAEHESVLQDAIKVITTSVQLDNLDNCSIPKLSSEQLMNNLHHVSFNGLTGSVLFQKDGSRAGTVASIKQYRFDTQQLQHYDVAFVEKNRLGNNYSVMYKNDENLTTLWPDGIPSDETVIDGTHLATFIVFLVLYGILIVFDFGCLLFTVIFRNRRVIKLTSPVLSYVTIFGAAFFGSALIFYNIPIYSTSLLIPVCIIRPTPLIIGHDICFGIVLLKLFRIHHIFLNSKPNKKVIKDWHLLLILAIIIVIILVVYIILMSVGFTILARHHLTINEEIPYSINNLGLKVLHFTYVCGTPMSDIVLVALAILNKFVLHTIAIVLAVRTRKIEVNAVNEAKEIHAIVYSSTVIIIIVAVTTLATDGFPNLQGILVGLFVYIECITFIGLSFIPKMVYLWKDPDGKEIFKNMKRPPMSYAKAESTGKSTV